MQASVVFKDILLVLVVISSMIAAITFPDFGSRFRALPFYCLMVNFFLSYLSIDLGSVWKTLKGHSAQIFMFTAMKPAILPSVIYSVFLLLFALINLGVFYRYSSFFKKDPSVIILATIVAFVLAAIYGTVGIVFFRKGPMENQLAGAVMLANVNNVLVIVFSSKFFGPLESVVATMYMVPFFVIVLPLRYYHHRKTRAAKCLFPR